MKADNKSKIDFVVLWVDDSDPVWRENNFEEHKKMIIEQFEKILPEKSGFEL